MVLMLQSMALAKNATVPRTCFSLFLFQTQIVYNRKVCLGGHRDQQMGVFMFTADTADPLPAHIQSPTSCQMVILAKLQNCKTSFLFESFFSEQKT